MEEFKASLWSHLEANGVAVKVKPANMHRSYDLVELHTANASSVVVAGSATPALSENLALKDFGIAVLHGRSDRHDGATRVKGHDAESCGLYLQNWLIAEAIDMPVGVSFVFDPHVGGDEWGRLVETLSTWDYGYIESTSGAFRPSIVIDDRCLISGAAGGVIGIDFLGRVPSIGVLYFSSQVSRDPKSLLPPLLGILDCLSVDGDG